MQKPVQNAAWPSWPPTAVTPNEFEGQVKGMGSYLLDAVEYSEYSLNRAWGNYVLRTMNNTAGVNEGRFQLRDNPGPDFLALFGDQRNKFLNGQFSILQRQKAKLIPLIVGIEDNFTFEGLDRWSTFMDGGDNYEQLREEFSMGQTEVPNNPKHYLRCQFQPSSAQTTMLLGQYIEGVETLAGRQITLTFWYRAVSGDDTDASVYCQQDFGTGGTPSADVFRSFSSLSLVYDNTWRKYTSTVDVPSLDGQTLGTDGNDFFRVVLFQTNVASSNFVIDIANASVVEGDATQEEDPGSPWAPWWYEQWLCQRYYNVLSSGLGERYGLGSMNDAVLTSLEMPIEMYGDPTTVFAGGLLFNNIASSDASRTNRYRAHVEANVQSNGAYSGGNSLIVSEAEVRY